jgi:hypothetical protein
VVSAPLLPLFVAPARSRSFRVRRFRDAAGGIDSVDDIICEFQHQVARRCKI